MEFDLSTAIISIFALSVFFIPILYDYRSKNNRVIEKQFLELVKTKKLDIDNYEIWGKSFALSIDKEYLHFFYHNFDDPTKDLLIDLFEIEKCSLDVVNFKPDKIDRIELVLKAKSSTHKILLYRNLVKSNAENELKLAKKWYNMLNDCIS